MSNLTTYPLQDWFETTLAQAWNWAVGTVYLNTAPTFTFPSGVTTYIVVNPGKTTMQVAEIDSYDSWAKTVNVSSISVEKWASVNYSQQTHAVGSKVIISDNYQFWKDIVDSINSKVNKDVDSIIADNVELQFGSTAASIYTDDTGTNLKFKDGSNPAVSLSTLAAGAWADTKVAITVNDTTTAVLDSKLTAGDGLSKTVGNPWGNETLDLDVDTSDTTVFVKTSSGAGDEDKVPVLNASWQLASGFIDLSLLSKFGWDSSDGVVDGTGDITITGSNDTYIVKNYSSWAAGWASRTLTITPTNCLLHIKVKGDCDLTNWTFNFEWKWWQGWVWWVVNGSAWASGSSWSDLIVWLVNSWGWGGNLALSSTWTWGGWWAGISANATAWVTVWGNPWWLAGSKALFWALTTIIPSRRYVMYIGAGWGGGWVGSGAGSSWVWGNWGNWWWAVILEVFGNLTLDNGTTVINMNWTAGGNGVAGTNAGAGWGGGWGGGTFLAIYNGTLTGTVTPTVAAGAGGTGQNGGSTLWSNGWAGGAGEYAIVQNTVFL